MKRLFCRIVGHRWGWPTRVIKITTCLSLVRYGRRRYCERCGKCDVTMEVVGTEVEKDVDPLGDQISQEMEWK